MAKLQVKVGGMSCSFCAETLRKSVGRLDGVEKVSVSLAHEEALVEYDPARVDASRITGAIRSVGYTVRDPRKVRTFEDEDAEVAHERNRLIIAAAFTWMALVQMALMWLGRPWPGMRWLMPLLALATVFSPGFYILRMAVAALRRSILHGGELDALHGEHAELSEAFSDQALLRRRVGRAAKNQPDVVLGHGPPRARAVRRRACELPRHRWRGQGGSGHPGQLPYAGEPAAAPMAPEPPAAAEASSRSCVRPLSDAPSRCPDTLPCANDPGDGLDDPLDPIHLKVGLQDPGRNRQRHAGPFHGVLGGGHDGFRADLPRMLSNGLCLILCRRHVIQ